MQIMKAEVGKKKKLKRKATLPSQSLKEGKKKDTKSGMKVTFAVVY